MKLLLGLMPGSAVPTAWLKWVLAHSMGTLLFATPIFAWLYCERVNIGLSAFPCFGNSLRFAKSHSRNKKSKSYPREVYKEQPKQ